MKKQKQKLYKSNRTPDTGYQTVIKIAVGVLITLILVYFTTAILSGEIKFGSKEKVKEETEIQYQEIIAGESFNRNDKEYYVLFLDK